MDGYNFNVGTLKIKYRKAKITPKKIGQFVTLSASIAVLWKPDDQITQWAL
ncbi:MepB family protein [uncultured Sphingobacterium sp.]|uniref:MepB family protein n=1 Tax=uncultured Sphingobacterium sp. TaxID=182688 RepID=UPI00345B8882